MEVIVSLVHKIIQVTYGFLTSIFILLSRKKTLSNERLEVLKWISESCGTEIRSLQELWDMGPHALGIYIEQLNNQDVTWWVMQDLARSTFAVPQVMTRREMESQHLRGHAEKKFLRLLLRLKEALERSVDVGPQSLRVSGDLIAKGVALSAAHTGRRGVFFIYSYRNQLEGVQIEMKGPGKVTVETKARRDGLMVGYIVDRSGMYVLEISKNNWFVPGSPFYVNVQDPPPGYTGNFGSNLWGKPETEEYQLPPVAEPPSQPNSLQWEPEREQLIRKDSEEMSPSRPSRKKKIQKTSSNGSKQQIVELSQIAAAIILARRFTNKMQSRIPELRVERPNDQQTELNLWSNIAGPPSLREITYVSPEGATFPISVSNRRDTERHKKWNEHGNQNLEDWILSRATDYNRGGEPYLCLPEQDVFPKNRQSIVTFQRGSSNIVRPVRPFNQCLTTSLGSEPESMKRLAEGRIWTHCTSIGVNTDESWINSPSAPVELNKEYKSQGVQVGSSFGSLETVDANTFQYNHYEMKDALSQGEYQYQKNERDYQRIDYGLQLKEQKSNDSGSSRNRKCDTFNSDDTSSSVATNYSEKIIEMDLKVHYETIALTSTDDERISHTPIPNENSKYNQDLHSMAVHQFSGNSKICGKESTEENLNETTKPSRKLVKEPSVDGIYKATLMSIDCSPIKSDLSTSEGSTDNVNYQIYDYDQIIKISTEDVQYQGTEYRPVYERNSYTDELVKLRSDYNLNDNTQKDGSNFCVTSENRNELIRQFDLNHMDDRATANTRKIELKRLKQLMKKKWTSKIPSRRVVKQGSGACKRHLRKTLSLIPKLKDQDESLGQIKTSALYSFGPYPVKKDIVHIPTPVRDWKNFWDNIANRKETIIRRDCSIRNKGLVRKGKTALQKLSQGKADQPDVVQDEDRKRSIIHIEYNVVCIGDGHESVGSYQRRTWSEEWKSKCHGPLHISTVDSLVDRFKNAKRLFTELEKDETLRSHTIVQLKSTTVSKESDYQHQFEPHWDLKNLFQDFNQGLGKPGVVNRLGVLASLQSVEPIYQIGGYELHYPHLPISSREQEKTSLVRHQNPTKLA